MTLVAVARGVSSPAREVHPATQMAVTEKVVGEAGEAGRSTDHRPAASAVPYAVTAPEAPGAHCGAPAPCILVPWPTWSVQRDSAMRAFGGAHPHTAGPSDLPVDPDDA